MISTQIKYRIISLIIIYNFQIVSQHIDLQTVGSMFMEKSMVRQFSSLGSSQFFNRSTFISTAYNEDSQLRKSKIQNLPSYRKENLSTRLDFVVVFQTIQIERLSTEIQALRIALKDAQRQNFNVHNYEIQIRELTEKLHSYETQRNQHFEENERMNIICQRLYEDLQEMKKLYADIDPTLNEKYRLQTERNTRLQGDIQKWRNRFNALEISKNRQMEDMRLQMQSQRKSMIDRQISQLTIKFNSQRQNLENQMRKLRDNLQTKNAQILIMNNKISHLEVINQQMRQNQSAIMNYESKFALISHENIRLNELLRVKQEEIQRISNNEEKLKWKVNELNREIEFQRVGGHKANQLQKDLQQWKFRYQKLEQNKLRGDRELTKLPQLQAIIQQRTLQAERMKDSIKQKMRDNQQLRFKYSKVVNQFEFSKKQQQQRIPLLQNKLQQLNMENDRMNQSLKARARQLESWRHKYGNLEKEINKIYIIERERDNLRSRLDDQIRQNDQLSNNNRQLQNQTRDYQIIKRNLYEEKQAKQEYIGEIQRLNKGIRNMSGKLEEQDRKCMNLQRKLQSYLGLQQQIQAYKRKQINLTKQIDRINGILNQKVKQLHILKDVFKRMQNSLTQYEGLEQKMIGTMKQIQKLLKDLDQSRKQSSFYQQKSMITEGELKRIKNEIYILIQQKQQAIKLYNNKSKEFDYLLSESEQLRGQFNVLKQKEARSRQLQSKFRETEEKLSQVSRKINKEKYRNQQLNAQLERKTEELMKIKRQGILSPEFKQELTQIKMQNEQKERQVRNLQIKIGQMESIIKRLKQAINRNDQICRKNHQKWSSITKQIDISTILLQKTMEMNTQIFRLSEDNMKLQSKIRILTVELDSKSSMNETRQVSVLSPRKQYSFGLSQGLNGYSRINSSRTNNYGIDLSKLSPKSFKYNFDFM